ncbi:hypothetical protein KKE60_04915 [Patescibacteria group bacterium]|nr:hypothetical protein [Patescibacteria group bacterium]
MGKFKKFVKTVAKGAGYGLTEKEKKEKRKTAMKRLRTQTAFAREQRVLQKERIGMEREKLGLQKERLTLERAKQKARGPRREMPSMFGSMGGPSMFGEEPRERATRKKAKKRTKKKSKKRVRVIREYY